MGTEEPRVGRLLSQAAVLSLLLVSLSAGSAGIEAVAAAQPLAELKADVDLDIEDGEFEIIGTFTLGAGSNGVDLASEALTLAVKGGKASFSITVPEGSFKKDSRGHFSFRGNIARVRLLASIRLMRPGTYQFEMEGDRVNLNGVANPVTVSLTVGDDDGGTTVQAKIE
jgi:hypothetical protein